MQSLPWWPSEVYLYEYLPADHELPSFTSRREASANLLDCIHVLHQLRFTGKQRVSGQLSPASRAGEVGMAYELDDRLRCDRLLRQRRAGLIDNGVEFSTAETARTAERFEANGAADYTADWADLLAQWKGAADAGGPEVAGGGPERIRLSGLRTGGQHVRYRPTHRQSAPPSTGTGVGSTRTGVK